MSGSRQPTQTSFLEDGEGIGDAIGDLERWCARQELDWIVGVDEAGRGPLAGPVHAGAVALRISELEEPWIASLDDSKKLSEEERVAAFETIRGSTASFSIVSASPDEIDDLNILQAARKAMAEAVESACGTLEEQVDCVFVDGDTPLEIARRQRTLVRGDGRSYAIAAASILAKVSRDRVMVEYDDRWPAYDFASNKGYPTPAHRSALEEHGPCSIHRRSFSGVED